MLTLANSNADYNLAMAMAMAIADSYKCLIVTKEKKDKRKRKTTFRFQIRICLRDIWVVNVKRIVLDFRFLIEILSKLFDVLRFSFQLCVYMLMPFLFSCSWSDSFLLLLDFSLIFKKRFIFHVLLFKKTEGKKSRWQILIK